MINLKCLWRNGNTAFITLQCAFCTIDFVTEAWSLNYAIHYHGNYTHANVLVQIANKMGLKKCFKQQNVI
jgi:hypothetical protein